MQTLLAVLGFVVGLCKAILAALSLKEKLDQQAERERANDALNRHEVNARDIADTIARGVRDAQAARDRQGPGTPPPPAASGRDSSGS